MLKCLIELLNKFADVWVAYWLWVSQIELENRDQIPAEAVCVSFVLMLLGKARTDLREREREREKSRLISLSLSMATSLGEQHWIKKITTNTW